jgi:hypothetical protein
MSVSSSTAKLLSAIFCLTFALPALPVSAQAPKTTVLRYEEKMPVSAQTPKALLRYDEKKKPANDIAVSIMVSGLTCTLRSIRRRHPQCRQRATAGRHTRLADSGRRRPSKSE